ncbi:MAG TPA: FIST N-terminal domain-containing protein, partial [Rhodocyclaceae bacterium]|nr:FIST N-terminal domain-containing protein [Rhodocyclaceae bacterium]
MQPASFVHAHAAHADWRIALAQAVSQIQADITARSAQQGRAAEYTLGFCYLTDYYAAHAEAIVDALHAQLPGVAWVGTVGIGVSAGGTEYIDEPALALMIAPLARDAFRLFSGLQPLSSAPAQFVAHTALVHAEASTPDVQELLEELATRTATGYLFGGLASSRTRTLHIADHVLEGGLSGVAFGAEVELISRVTQGCQPIGPARTITAGEGNYVITLDDRAALDCVLDDLHLDAALEDDELAEALSGTLVGLSCDDEDMPALPGQFGTDTIVRHLVGVDPLHRVLAIADQVDPGRRLAFCTRNAIAAQADLERIATEVRREAEARAGARMAGALYVSCSGRGGPHFGAR